MTGLADAKRAAHALLDVEEHDAWFEYLEATRSALMYETVEPYAWARLEQRLHAIVARRRRVSRGPQ